MRSKQIKAIKIEEAKVEEDGMCGIANEKIEKKRSGRRSKSKATNDNDDDDWKIKLKQISIVQLRFSEAIQIKGIIFVCHSQIAFSFLPFQSPNSVSQ